MVVSVTAIVQASHLGTASYPGQHSLAFRPSVWKRLY